MTDRPPAPTRVVNKKRSDKLAGQWKDPTLGADGLTYAQRTIARMHAGRDRKLAAAAAARISTGTGAGGAPPADPPPPDPEKKVTAPPSRRRGMLRRWA